MRGSGREPPVWQPPAHRQAATAAVPRRTEAAVTARGPVTLRESAGQHEPSDRQALSPAGQEEAAHHPAAQDAPESKDHRRPSFPGTAQSAAVRKIDN